MRGHTTVFSWRYELSVALAPPRLFSDDAKLMIYRIQIGDDVDKVHLQSLTLEVSGRGRNATSLARHAVRGPLERIVRMQHATKTPGRAKAPAMRQRS
jgi:hypothetical protein